MDEPEIGKWFPKGDDFSREEAKKSFYCIQEHWTHMVLVNVVFFGRKKFSFVVID